MFENNQIDKHSLIHIRSIYERNLHNSLSKLNREDKKLMLETLTVKTTDSGLKINYVSSSEKDPITFTLGLKQSSDLSFQHIIDKKYNSMIRNFW